VDALIGFDLAENCPADLLSESGILRVNVLLRPQTSRRETLECEPHRPLKLCIYDLRTNKPFTLKENPLKRSDLDDFVACYNPRNRHERKESERFKSFTYEELTKRDKLNLDIFWLKDESLEDSANLPDPGIIAAEIVEDLQAALAQFAGLVCVRRMRQCRRRKCRWRRSFIKSL